MFHNGIMFQPSARWFKRVPRPFLALSVNGPIFPGQLPTINWSIHNDCSDLRTVQAQVFFGPTKLYESVPNPIGLRASISRDNKSLFPIPNSFCSCK